MAAEHKDNRLAESNFMHNNVANNVIICASISREILTHMSDDFSKEQDILKTRLESVLYPSVCDPTANSINALYRIATGSKKSKTYIRDISELINKTSQYVQEINKKQNESADYNDIDIQNLYIQASLICKNLDKFSAKIAGIKWNEMNNNNKEEYLSEMMINIKKYINNIDLAYNKALKSFTERDEIKYAEINKIKSQIWSTVLWLWKWKFAIYITGYILWDIYDFVYIPGQMQDFLNIFARTIGALCYAFSGSVVVVDKFLNTFINTAMYSLHNVIKLIIPSKILAKLADVLLGASLGLLYFFSIVFNHITRNIAKNICVLIMNIIAGSDVISNIGSQVFTIIVKQGTDIINDVVSVSTFLYNFLINTVGVTASIFQSIFDVLSSSINGVFKGIIPFGLFTNPIGTIQSDVRKHIIGSTVNAVNAVASATGSNTDILAASTLENTANVVENIGDEISIMDDAANIVDSKDSNIHETFMNIIAAKYKTTEGEQAAQEAALDAIFSGDSTAIKNMINTSIGHIIKRLSIFGTTLEEIPEKFFNKMDDSMQRLGTKKVYNAIKNLDIKENYLMGIILFMFGIIGFVINAWALD